MNDFLGFRFGGVHTEDLHLKVVSSSNRYQDNTLPSPSDSTQTVPGGDGQYYFGSTYSNRTFSCNFAFDQITEKDLRRIRQLFSGDQLKDLVFDEEPYKHWRAKLSSQPDLSYICFTDENGQRVYKGEGSVSFICYFPYAFGFDKYVVRAADYYMLNPPECMIAQKGDENNFIHPLQKDGAVQIQPEDIKYHYNARPSDYHRDPAHCNHTGSDGVYKNWEPNDRTPWKTGFPTTEQVQAGELYFDTPEGPHSIMDVRGYWDNIPEWEGTAQLLTSPTLDFEQELMYMPQYSKVDFINTDIGYNHYRPMIGARILVYNPGDLPVDWEIRFNDNKRGFWSSRGGETFRIRRFNVERLSIPNAVDWCGLTTYDPADNEPFKYGSLYFKRRIFDREQFINNIESYEGELEIYKPDGVTLYTREEIIEAIRNGHMVCDKHWDDEDGTVNQPYEDWSTAAGTHQNQSDWVEPLKTAFNLHLNDYPELFDGVVTYDNLGEAHPHHCYYAEPIPRQSLGNFIKLFYWQTLQWRGNKTYSGEWTNLDLWKEMMPSDFWVDPDLKNKIKDVTHPLVNFIRMFNEISEEGEVGDPILTYREKMSDLDFEEGVALAARYDELRALCLDEQEEFQLYWEYLIKLLKCFTPMIEGLEDSLPTTGKNGAYSIEDFIYDYINMPLEYIRSDTRDLDYGSYIFNAFKYPEWITEDYLEVDQSKMSGATLVQQYMEAIELDADSIFVGKQEFYDSSLLNGQTKYSKLQRELDKRLGDGGCLNDLLDDVYYCNSEMRMLYTTENPLGMEFVYKPSKNIQNDAISKGKWFKLPPGWSLLDVEPVTDETLWGGKRWRDGRPYDWGYGGDLYRHEREVQQLYDMINDLSRQEFLRTYKSIDDIVDHTMSTDNTYIRTRIAGDNEHRKAVGGEIGDYQWTSDTSLLSYKDNWYGTEDNLDELFKFKAWYAQHLMAYPKTDNYFAYSLYKKQQNNAEYAFLKRCDEIWQSISCYYNWTPLKGVFFDPDTGETPSYDVTGQPLRCINGDIGDWWWYACNYLWANFPPLFWAYADLLNNLNIKYIPLFY